MLAGPAGAGPWPRDRGKLFFIESVTLRLDGTREFGSWVEYGLRNSWQIVAEARHGADGEWRIGVLLQRPLPDFRGWKQALTFGGGLRSEERQLEFTRPVWQPPPHRTTIDYRVYIPTTRLGYHVGRGLDYPWPGWATLDLGVEVGRGERSVKADLTIGFRPREKLALILGVQMARRQGQSVDLALAPSVLWQLHPRLGLELGTRLSARPGPRQIRLAAWVEF